ncbi:MAG: hypothetical protein HN348_21795 [Proteobacteria bacterium]|jgi:hypothetical protein|nr:hypothetical protein [Pseudomonadota bacterium]
MEFGERPENIEQQLAEVREQLHSLQDASVARLLLRLERQAPGHPLLLLNQLTRIGSFILIGLSVTSLLLPLFLPRNLAIHMSNINIATEMVVPGGIPVLLFLLGACTTVGWWMSRQAAASLGREAPLLAEEQRAHQRLMSKVARLDSQKGVMDRIRGTPVPHQMRTPMPQPARNTPHYSILENPEPASQKQNSGYDYPLGLSSYSDDEPHEETPDLLGSTTRGGTPLGAKPRSGHTISSPSQASDDVVTPVTVKPSAASSFGQIFGTPVPGARELSYGSPSKAEEYGELDRIDLNQSSFGTDYDDEPDNRVTSGNVGYGIQPQSGRLPRWGPIPHTWLAQAIEGAEALSQALPMQAHLEFSTEDDLPFTLVIKRANPALAVRTMMSFVEFLANIPTPPRARIRAMSASSMDRTFHHNVISALEPYFPDSAEIDYDSDQVDIIFLEPHRSWGEYPRLPIV